MPDTSSVEAYLASLPEAPRAALEGLRKVVRDAAPEAEETMAYDMPAFLMNGRFLVSFGAYSRHCSLFPASAAVREAYGEELARYLYGKGTIRFQADDPLPTGLIRKIVAVRLDEVRTAGPR